MADTKITALTALTGANSAPTDLLPIVDVSDTTMAASGTSKSITREGLQTFSLGTITTDRKIADYSATWNNGAVTFTGIKVSVTDTASNSASRLIDLQVGGATKLNVTAAGLVTAAYGFVASDANAGFKTYDALITQSGMTTGPTGYFAFANTDAATVSAETIISRPSSNSIKFGVTSSANTATSRTQINKAVASIADNTATATFTVTVPNAAHSAMLKVTLVGSLGAGGAVGANEATGTISYDFAIARTAGVDTVVGASTAYGSTTAAVAGAATITVTAAASAMTGASSAQQTFTINVTIARGSGSSTNHTCLCYGRLLNANATGITIA